MIRRLALATILSIAELHASGLEVYYTPFDAKTSGEICKKNIEKVSLVVLKVAGAFEADQILNLIAPSVVQVNMCALRLKIVFMGDVYYFDGLGRGIKNGKQLVMINRSEFEKNITWDSICIKLNDESKLKTP
jgi:hypothetical protein